MGIWLSRDLFPPNPPAGMIRLEEQTMNGLNDAYVESVIKKAISGKLTTGQAAAKLGVTKQYVNKLKRAYA